MDAINNRKYGKDYADNHIDNLLSFNLAQTWTVSAGTGSATLDTSNPFEGISSLKIENTDIQNSSLTVTNSAQSTVIPYDGDYRLSLMAYKDIKVQDLTLEVEIFKNAVSLATESLTIGSTSSDDDIDQLWQRFMSDAYSFLEGDVITFTFTLNQDGTYPLTLEQIWIDGLMLHSENRISKVAPNYSKPLISEFENRFAGFGYYSDSETSPATQTFNTTPSKLQIDGTGANTETGYLPYEIRSSGQLWDTTNDKITPISIGDSYLLRIDLGITSETASPTEMIVQLDIGGGASPTTVVVDTYEPTGKSTPYDISISFPIFSLSTFKTNGGQIFISTDTGSVTVSERAVQITRTSSGSL